MTTSSEYSAPGDSRRARQRSDRWEVFRAVDAGGAFGARPGSSKIRNSLQELMTASVQVAPRRGRFQENRIDLASSIPQLCTHFHILKGNFKGECLFASNVRPVFQSVFCAPPLLSAVVLLFHDQPSFCFVPPQTCPAPVLLRRGKLRSKCDHFSSVPTPSTLSFLQFLACLLWAILLLQHSSPQTSCSSSHVPSSCCDLICDATTAVFVCKC